VLTRDAMTFADNNVTTAKKRALRFETLPLGIGLKGLSFLSVSKSK
jgi:hypothetical protein